MINGDDVSRARWFTYAAVSVTVEVVGAKGSGSATKLSGAGTKLSKIEKLNTRINQIDFSRFRDPFPEGNLVPVGGYNALDSNTLLDQMYMKVDNVSGTRRNKGEGKNKLEGQFTKGQLVTKPSYSPAPDKWTKKSGTVTIDEDGTWVYTNKRGQTVKYPNGYPDFTEYTHPTVKPVEIEVTRPTNRSLDYKNANIKAGLSKDSNPRVPLMNKPPLGYTWHHHQDGKIMILVKEKIHAEFTHAGGISTVNKTK